MIEFLTARKLSSSELVLQGIETMVPFPALPEVHRGFQCAFPTALFSTLNASTWLFQAGSASCCSVFGVFLVSSCYKRGVFFLQPEHLSAVETYWDCQNSTIRFYPHSTCVRVRKKYWFFKVEIAHSIGSNVCPRPLRKPGTKAVFPIFPSHEAIVSHKTYVEMYKDL